MKQNELIDHTHRTPNEIIIAWVALSHKMGYRVTMTELAQFGELMTAELITFIMIKQAELEARLGAENV